MGRSEIADEWAKEDRAGAEDAEFAEWLAALERIMGEWDRKYGNLPYALPLKSSTGLDCWREMFDEQMTPQEAFDEDQSSWSE